ncbi:MAG: hypothetical protein PVF74_06630 [Anaerolineales bacterium]
MEIQSLSDEFEAVAVAILLIFTAWGNAMAMLIVAAIGLFVFVLISRKNIPRGGVIAAIAGFILSIVIALAMMLL